jgi:hypothetical protein
VVIYRCEDWTLKTRDEQQLRIFEHKILRKMFGPIQDKHGSWRIRMNHELNELIGNADIVRFIKSKRLAWLGHVIRMGEKRIPKEYSNGNQQAGELEEDQEKYGLKILKKISRR